MTDRYIEVRYEDLLCSGIGELKKVFKFLDVTFTDALVADTCDRFAFDRLQNDAYSRDVFLSPGVARASGTAGLAEPNGFFRKGVAGDWKNSLSATQLREIQWVAGELLTSLGYFDEYIPMTGPPLSIRRRLIIARFRSYLKAVGAYLFS